MPLTREDALSGIRDVLADLRDRGLYGGDVDSVAMNTMVHEICVGQGSVDFDLFLDALRKKFDAQLPFDEQRLLNYGDVDRITSEVVSASYRAARV